MPRSAVLGHAETLLAAMRHLITNENSAAHFLRPGAATGAKLHGGRKDSPDHQTARGFERGQRRPGMGEIPSFPGRAQDGHRAHDGQRDCVGRASRRQHHGRLSSPKAMHQMPSICMGPQAAKFGHLGWPACINIAKCLQLVRTAESFAAPTSIIGSNFVGANSDSSADPFAILDLPSAPNRIWEWRSPRERAGGPTGRRRAGSGSYREDIQ